MPSNPTLRHMTWLLSGLALLFILVWQAPAFYIVHGLANYLPVHIFAETFSIVISMLVFGVAWNAYSIERPSNIVILACALLAVGLIDFAHMLSFKGMPDFITPSGPEKAINLWLSGRLLAALALLAVSLRPWRPFPNTRSRYGLLVASLIVTALVVWAGLVYPQAWPRTFIAGQGLTTFKIGAEYAIVAILLVSAVLFYRQAQRQQSDDVVGLFAATVITILSELSFTLYSDVADVFNLLGHLYKIVAYAFIYRAVFVASVRDPFRRLDAEFAENRRISQELRTASSYTRSLVEASLDPLVTISAEGKITDVNQATEKVTGCSRNELVGTDFSDYFTEPDKAREGYRQVFAQGSVTDYPLALRHRDGHVTDVLYNASVYRNEAGEVLGVFAAARDITERKRADATRMQLAAIVESSNDAVIGKTPEGIITSWNKSAEAIYGYSADEVVGKSITMLAPPSRHAEIRDILETVRKGGTVANHESERVRKDGTPIKVALTLSPIRDAAGNLTGISTIARDITEKKRMEERLHQASVYNRSLIEASLDPLVTISAEGKITDVNQATEKVTGMSRSELIGTDFSDYFTEPDKARRGYQQVFAQGYVTDYPLELRHRDGHVTNVLYNASVYRGEGGEVMGVFAAARDITERKLAEEQLRRSEHSLAEAQRIAHVGNWELDLVSNVLTWSDEIYRIFEIDPQEFGASYEAFLNAIHPGDREMVNKAYSDSVASKVPYDIVHRLQMHDGRVKYVNERCETYYAEDGKPLRSVGTVHDITERKEAENKITELNHYLEARVAERTAQLEAANKELEAFSYSVSHDLRTPLRAIDGFSRILLDDYQDKLDDEGKRLLNVVRDNTNRMGRLIDDILQFSRTGRMEITLAEIDMERMAHAVFEELQPAIAGRELQLEIEHLPPARGDSAMMHQVFVNLLSNAIKFSRKRDPARIKVGSYIEGAEAVYYVRDNGAGFDQQYAGKLFGVFQRLHGITEFEGTGIGLAIVKRIITRHGGRVWAEGKIDQGATIYFALPTKEAANG